MSIEVRLDTVRGAIELANAASKIEAAPNRRQRQLKEAQQAIEALRRIYFSPRGVLRTIDDIASGGRPSADEIEMILPEFNDYEFRVRFMLDRLEVPDNSGLTLRAQRVLREISYGKSGIRKKVKDLLNESLTYGNEISTREAAELCDEILALNQAIENAEEALVLASRP